MKERIETNLDISTMEKEERKEYLRQVCEQMLEEIFSLRDISFDDDSKKPDPESDN